MLVLAAPRWVQKPTPPSQLDIDHPLCPDHCWPFLSPQGTAIPLCKNQVLLAPTVRGDIYAGSSSMVPGRKYGLSVRHGATTDTTRLTANLASELQKVVPSSGGFSIMVAYRKVDTTLRGNAMFGTPGSGFDVARCDVYMLYPGPTNTYWCYGGTTEGVTQLSLPNASIVSGDDLWVFTTGPRGMEMWQNGKLIASNTANPTRSDAPYLTNNLGLSSFEPPSISDLADTALVMTWRRQLPMQSVRQISANPWQVFQPATVMYIGSVGAPATTAAGSSSGTSTATAVGQVRRQAAGTAAGTSTASAVGTPSTAVVSATGTSAGVSTATAVGRVRRQAAGTAAGTSTAQAISVFQVIPDVRIKLPDGSWRSLMSTPWRTRTFSAGNYSALDGVWTAVAEDIVNESYRLDSSSCLFSFTISVVSLTGTPDTLQIRIPAGLVAARSQGRLIQGNLAPALASVEPESPFINLDSLSGPWPDSDFDVIGDIEFEVKQP